MPSSGDPSAWRLPPAPGAVSILGRYVRLAPLAASHAHALHAAYGADDRLWDFMGVGPFPDAEAYSDWVRSVAGLADPRFFALIDRSAEGPGGVASLMRIDPANGVIEIGNICLSPALQRTRAASEALFLLADWAFNAGYRRLEWKCNAANAPSRRAAARFGFVFEGVFRQHMIVKGRNRDTAWFSILDREWPALRDAHRRWLDPGNFDDRGRQRQALSALTAAARAGMASGA